MMNRRDAIISSGWLAGYALTSASLSTLFLSCQAEVKLDWQPVFLPKKEAHTLAEVTETILPKTSTPGAKELGVPQFIDKVLKDVLGEDDQKKLLEGLKQIEAEAKEKHGKSFAECSVEERQAILLALDEAAAKQPGVPSVWGITLGVPPPTPFFRQLKSLTLLGYYTAEEVGKNILRYDPVPGDYVACMPLKEGENTWAE